MCSSDLLEAHAVQVLYLLKNKRQYSAEYLSVVEQEYVLGELLTLADSPSLERAIPVLKLCKERKLI